jgi:hypothetical protein
VVCEECGKTYYRDLHGTAEKVGLCGDCRARISREESPLSKQLVLAHRKAKERKSA